MESHPSDVAARLYSRAGLRGYVILSRDGFVLRAFPEGAEETMTSARLRIAGLGEPSRGFVQFHDELWAFVRRSTYSAFAVAEPAIRPGLLLDLLDQALLDQEPRDEAADHTPLDDEVSHEHVPHDAGFPEPFARSEVPEAAQSLHDELNELDLLNDSATHEPGPAADDGTQEQPPAVQRFEDALVPEHAAYEQAFHMPSHHPVPTQEDPQEQSEDEIDPVALAWEFGNLLQEGPRGDE